MKILVTGCDGQIGKTLINSGVKYGFKMAGFSKENLNITSKLIVNDVFNLEKPDLVINAAAYTKVDNAEKFCLNILFCIFLKYIFFAVFLFVCIQY
jgi:dTDP-4-dehydrorhamnose reductase